MRRHFFCLQTSFLSVLSAWNMGCSAQQPQELVMDSLSRTLSTLEPIVTSVTTAPTDEDRAQANLLRGEGLALRNQGRMEEAIATLHQSVILDPTHLGGYVILGWTQHLNNQREEAEATLKQAIAIDANHVPALNALGIVYLVDGQLERAVKTHTQALELTPSNEIAAYNLSLAYQRLQDYRDAIAHAVLATELEPDNPHPWVALAIAHDSAGDVDAAELAYQHARQLDSRYGDRTHLDHLEKAGFSPEQIQLTASVLNRL